MFWAKILKLSEFLSENFHFLVVKFSIYLNRHVVVMILKSACESTLSDSNMKKICILAVQKASSEESCYIAYMRWLIWNIAGCTCAKWCFFDVEALIDFFITKTCLYNFDPLKHHFYIVKLGFTGVYIIFLISAQKHRLWVLVRTASPRRF